MKFSIRDLFWLTVAVALTLGWWVDHSRQKAKRNEAEEAAFDDRILGERYKSILEEAGYRFTKENGNSTILRPGESPNSWAPAPNPPKE